MLPEIFSYDFVMKFLKIVSRIRKNPVIKGSRYVCIHFRIINGGLSYVFNILKRGSNLRKLLVSLI